MTERYKPSLKTEGGQKTKEEKDKGKEIKPGQKYSKY